VGLADRVAELEEVVARSRSSFEQLQVDGEKKDRTISAQAEQIMSQAERIKELEAALEEARRAGKRQASPFSKGAPKENPGRPGRKPGEGHGRHGHRMAPAGPPTGNWAPRCPVVARVVVARWSTSATPSSGS
jgi:hypothetical protein